VLSQEFLEDHRMGPPPTPPPLLCNTADTDTQNTAVANSTKCCFMHFQCVALLSATKVGMFCHSWLLSATLFMPLSRSSSNWSCFLHISYYYYSTEIREVKLVGIVSYLRNAYKVLFRVSEGKIPLEKLWIAER
jgi:hypothetical protein